MVLGKASFTAIMASAMLASTVEGHGYMSVPKVEFTFNGDTTQYMGQIDSSKSGFTGNFGQSPTDNTANFNKAFSASKYSSLKEFMLDKLTLTSPDFTKECGYTNPKGAAQPVPAKFVEWSHGSGEGFTASHEGPCEVWCDETRVFQDDNCPKNFPTAPAKLPYDHDACLGSSQLSIYWIALHSPSWQVYINCAPLEKSTSTGAKSKFAVGGGKSGGTTPATDSSSTDQTTDSSSSATTGGSSTEQSTDAPAAPSTPSTDAPAEAPSTPSTPETEAPAETPATDAPAETPAETPAPETPETPVVTPATEESKCQVRRRRRRN